MLIRQTCRLQFHCCHSSPQPIIYQHQTPLVQTERRIVAQNLQAEGKTLKANNSANNVANLQATAPQSPPTATTNNISTQNTTCARMVVQNLQAETKDAAAPQQLTKNNHRLKTARTAHKPVTHQPHTPLARTRATGITYNLPARQTTHSKTAHKKKHRLQVATQQPQNPSHMSYGN